MKNEMGEFANLAKDKKTADIRKELHAHLTSLVDPDAVTMAAFRKQEKILQERVRSMSKSEFYEDLEGRLGSIQARILAERHYGAVKS
jgi:hypothetical protein